MLLKFNKDTYEYMLCSSSPFLIPCLRVEFQNIWLNGILSYSVKSSTKEYSAGMAGILESLDEVVFRMHV